MVGLGGLGKTTSRGRVAGLRPADRSGDSKAGQHSKRRTRLKFDAPRGVGVRLKPSGNGLAACTLSTNLNSVRWVF